MYKFWALFALFGGAILGSAFGGILAADGEDPSLFSIPSSTSRPHYSDSDLYDCSGQNGNFHPHPTDCTRYLQCHNGRTADKPCADCNETRCPEGYLNWDVSLNTCNWPDVAVCGVSATQTTTDMHTTTPGPSGDCNATNCNIAGDCKSYWFCKRVNSNPDSDEGTLVTVNCNLNYFYVPVSSVVGSCVHWDNLSAGRKEEILRDPKCTYCDLISSGDPCSADYSYRYPNGVVESRTCASPLVFNRDSRGCVTKPTSCP